MRRVTVSPNVPQFNEQVKRRVGTLNRAVLKADRGSETITDNTRNFLVRRSVTEDLSMGVTPSEAVKCRQIRTTLELICPCRTVGLDLTRRMAESGPMNVVDLCTFATTWQTECWKQDCNEVPYTNV